MYMSLVNIIAKTSKLSSEGIPFRYNVKSLYLMHFLYLIHR